MFSKFRSKCLLVALVTLLGFQSSTILAGQEQKKDGILHILNGSDPSGELLIRKFSESWRVGGDDGEDFFGMISKVVIGDEGTIYLLDTRLSEIPVYSPDGERLTTLSREGEGPGETTTPSNLLFMPDGTLGIVQVFPGKITKIQVDGTPAGIIKVGGSDPTSGGFLQVYDCMRSGNDLVISGESITQAQTSQTRTNFLGVFDLEGNQKMRLLETPRTLDFTNAKFDETVNFAVDFRKFAIGPDGRTYVAAFRDQYALKVFLPDGALDRIIERKFESVQRTDAEYNDMKSAMENQIQVPFPIEITVSRSKPDVTSVEIGPDGNLWVKTSRSGIDQPDGILMTYDIFDLDGHFISQVAAKCDGDGENDNLIWTPEGDAILVTGYLEAIQSLMGGAGGEVEDQDAEPMEVIYLAEIHD
ncbi:MAG: hypothetical protein KOO60_09750 [Gemmatimonadales bacterium]|nr:hypothetical protein [Gemmatimonadales bacterium]